MQIDLKMIPPEVVEAAEHEACKDARPNLRAAIAAALNAWPGMTHMEPDLANGIIILPLPQQASDE